MHFGPRDPLNVRRFRFYQSSSNAQLDDSIGVKKITV